MRESSLIIKHGYRDMTRPIEVDEQNGTVQGIKQISGNGTLQVVVHQGRIDILVYDEQGVWGGGEDTHAAQLKLIFYM